MITDLLPIEVQTAAKECGCVIAVRCTGGSNAVLSCFKKNEAWREILRCDAFIGKAGAGKEREGDMKTPLGTFDLSMPFGILPDPSEKNGRKISGYLQITKDHYWCGQNGAYYNQLIDNSAPPEGYTPSNADEHLLDYRPSYHYGMLIEYNKEGRAHAGSAIFLHCIGKNPYTAGCVAVKEDVMRTLLLEVGSGAKIVIFE